MLGLDFDSKKNVSFSDGRIRGIRAKNGKITENLTAWVPCGLETVGMNRFYRSLNADRKISKVVTAPYEADFDDCVLVELQLFRRRGVQIYKVVQLQELDGTKPKCLQFSLEKDRTVYNDMRRDRVEP